MPRKTIAEFRVEWLQILDHEGNCDKKLMPSLSSEQIKRMYEVMVFSRRFDDKMLAMQRQGKIATFASVRGQEASTVGSAFALQKDDWMVPSFREEPAFFVRGFPAEKFLQLFGGDEGGNEIPAGMNILPVTVPVGTQVLHAVGIGMAMNIKKRKGAVLVYFGDGSTSEGDFHEGMNFAGVFKAPVVFFCQNNQWAISVPRRMQTASETLAQKAIAYGFSGVQVDGNDVFAVYRATFEALENARNGKGPTFIESYTYRIGDHTTADDATKYRDPKEVEEWKKKDPVERLRNYMMKERIWKIEDENRLLEDVDKKVEQAVLKFESLPQPPVDNIFKYTYKDMPQELKDQLESLKRFLKESEGGMSG